MPEVSRAGRKSPYSRSDRLEAVRLSLSMFDKEAAEQAGCAPSTISRWRRELQVRQPQVYERLCLEAEEEPGGLPVIDDNLLTRTGLVVLLAVIAGMTIVMGTGLAYNLLF